MARTIIMGLILLLGLPLQTLAGQITDVRVGKQTSDEIEIVIEGAYGAYQGVGLRAPARFVIDFTAAYLAESVPPSLEVEGSIVSGIKTITKGNDVGIVLESANSERLFHCTMHDKKGAIVIKCWMPKEVEAPAAVPVSASGSDSVRVSSPVLPKKGLSEIFGWPEKAAGPEYAEKEGKKKLTKYTGEKITLDFYKTGLHNVFRLFSEMSGKNIIIDDQVKGELTLSLKEVPWDEAMDLVLDLKELDKEEKLGTTIIKPKQEKIDTGKGQLVVKKFSEDILQPARILRKEKENRQKAQNFILEAHNLEALGKNKQALELYEKAQSLWKNNLDLIMKTASLHFLQSQYAESYYFAGQALQLNPKNSEAALYAAMAASKMGKQEDARQLFEIAIKARPEIPEALFNYALFLKKQKEFDKAMAMYQRHEQSFGPSLDVRLAIAGLCEIQGKASEACTKYEEISNSGFKMDKQTKRVVQKKIRTLCNQGED
jgi:type IV pilus assembly protein PilQ